MATSSSSWHFVVATLSLFVCLISAFNGSLKIRDLVIDAPFEADPQRTTNTTVLFVFSNQNLPKQPSTRCRISWAVGLPPPIKPRLGDCEDRYVRARFPTRTYHGIANFQLEVQHTYEDNNIGEYPYNSLSLTGLWNFTYDTTGEGRVRTTEGYTCDMVQSLCQSKSGVILEPEVLRAWS